MWIIPIWICGKHLFRFVIYVHFYHVYLNISNLLEVVSMHKHYPDHFCILGFKMNIVGLIEKSCKLCSKTVFNPNFYSHKSKMMFYTYSNGNESHVPISYYIALFDSWLLTLTFAWLFSWNFFLCCIWTCLYVSCMPHWYLINFMT